EYGNMPVRTVGEGAPTFVLMNGWGDPLTLTSAEVGTLAGYAWFDGTEYHGWVPTIPDQAALDKAFSDAGARLDPISGWSPCVASDFGAYNLVPASDVAEARWCVVTDGAVSSQAILDVDAAKAELGRLASDGEDVEPVPALEGDYLAVRGNDGSVNRYFLTDDGKLAGTAPDGTAQVWTPDAGFADTIANAQKG
ncbi:MAG: hypothetical protein Q4G46_16150, partial [Propionibacteriaceae bacterium]|nr:hypothetical protein [Propionibacteriaceae bacterium]